MVGWWSVIKVTVKITTFKGFSIGAKHYYVEIREEDHGDFKGKRFDNFDFEYKPHAKKWADMIISECFSTRSHVVLWTDETKTPEDYKLDTPGRY